MSKHLKKSSAISKKTATKLCNDKTQQNGPQDAFDETDTKKQVLADKLSELQIKLKKSFSAQFVESLCYFISTENQSQKDLELNLKSFQWSKLEYFLHQLKKICKQKQHLLLLLQKLKVNTVDPKVTSEPKILSSNKKSKQFNENIVTNENNGDKLELNSEVDNLFSSGEENFSLIRIIIRFLFKLFKFNCYSYQKRSEISNDPKHLFDLQLILLSVLADICFYEEIRLQVLNDPNLKCLFKVFTLLANLELDDKSDRADESFKKMKISWSKMCRLSANLCQDNFPCVNIKDLYCKDFISSLCKYLEKQALFIQSNSLSLNNLENNGNDLDLYHSLIRFLKFSYKLTKCKNYFLESRLLVHVCKALYRYNKNLKFSSDISDSSSDSNVDKQAQTILINEKSHFLCKDLIKNYLLMLDDWPQPSSNEFYNQIIEGNSIEHFLWLQIDDPLEQKSITSLPVTQKTSGSSSSKAPFDYSEFSFNLLLKLCHDYHVCRAEFGRVGGLTKYLNRIDLINSQTLCQKSSSEHDKLIEMLCFSCKESVNRLRLKEQNFLSTLVKHQQSLKSKLVAETSTIQLQSLLCSDSSIHNKLLVALCCFAHDQDSMNILMSNGLIDSLLGFLNDSILVEQRNRPSQMPTSKSLGTFSTVFRSDPDEKKTVLLNALLFQQQETKATDSDNLSKKRKASDTSLTPSSTPTALKRSKLTPLPTPLFFPPQPSNMSRSPDFETQLNQYNQYIQSTSPDSYCSLSPTSNPFSPAFSPPAFSHPASSPTNNHCNSAQMFTPSSSSNYYSAFSPVPSFNSRASPNFSYQSDDQPVANNIQFSPTIDRCGSDEEQEEEEEDEEMVTKENTDNGKKSGFEIIEQEMVDSNSVRGVGDEIVVEEDALEEDIEFVECELKSEAGNNKQSSQNETIKFTLDSSSLTDENMDDERLVGLLNTSKLSKSSESIEAIHRTEACVFYVLSQLSHGDRPTAHLVNHFEQITSGLLNYLHMAQVRNPRALRILNRLTKNHYCFGSLVTSYFPYKLKTTFFNGTPKGKVPRLDAAKLKDSGAHARRGSSNTNKKLTSSSSCTDLDKLKSRAYTTSFASSRDMHYTSIASSLRACSKEEDIEKEMNVYLNSNKVFFDAHTFFPSFESIEFTLVNNMKMQCISSSDHGYLSLVSMMKSSQKRHERLACALVAPFILRNSKALQNIMVHLNGIDSVLDQLLPSNTVVEESPVRDASLSSVNLRQNALICIRRILAFVNYKYDTKCLRDDFEILKQKFRENLLTNQVSHGLQNRVSFLFENESKVVDASSDLLATRSQYFNALLRGHFSEGVCNQSTGPRVVPITDISYETFDLLVRIMECGPGPDSWTDVSQELDLNRCIELVLAADKLFLTDLKELFISILLNQFLDLSTCFVCFKLAWLLSSSSLEKASVHYFLSRLDSTENNADMARKLGMNSMDTDEDDKKIDQSDLEGLDEMSKCNMLFDYAMESFKEENFFHAQFQQSSGKDKELAPNETLIIEHFKKSLKLVLCEIIKK